MWLIHVDCTLCTSSCLWNNSHPQSECPVSTELGKVSRNCTEFGWSEPFPHYIDACLYEEGNSSHVVSASLCVQLRHIQGFTQTFFMWETLCCLCLPCLCFRFRTCTTCRWRLCTLWDTAPLWCPSPWPWSSCAGSGETDVKTEEEKTGWMFFLPYSGVRPMVDFEKLI